MKGIHDGMDPFAFEVDDPEGDLRALLAKRREVGEYLDLIDPPLKRRKDYLMVAGRNKVLDTPGGQSKRIEATVAQADPLLLLQERLEANARPLTRQEKRRMRRQVRQGTFRARDHVAPAERVYMGKW